MKKLASLLLSLLLCGGIALAETPALSAEVYVSITDETGALVLACDLVTVTDADADGTLTISDALFAAHAENHEAAAGGFGTAVTEYGLSLTKLWGVENGGSYGYCLNDASAWSLLDPVAAGDHVKAYVYTDLAAWSDTYCWFDRTFVEAAAGSGVALTLSAAGFDDMWNPVTLPVAGAVLTVNGEAAEAVTDTEGKAVLTFAEAGVYVVSAVSETQNLVAPVCIVTVTAAE